MLPAKPDLVVSDILADAAPVRKLVINVGSMSVGALTLLEALDISEASGFDGDDFQAVMRRGSLRDKAKLMYAFAWVVARRVEPDLTYDEVCTYQLEIVGEPADQAKQMKKAETVVAVASLAGVSPEEAKNMSVAEVAAISDLHRKRARKRSTPKRRRVG